MPEPHVHLAVTLVEHCRKELVHLRGSSSGKKKSRDGDAASLFQAVQADHLQAGAVHEDRHGIHVADADEVRAVLDECHELLPLGLGESPLR